MKEQSFLQVSITPCRQCVRLYFFLENFTHFTEKVKGNGGHFFSLGFYKSLIVIGCLANWQNVCQFYLGNRETQRQFKFSIVVLSIVT